MQYISSGPIYVIILFFYMVCERKKHPMPIEKREPRRITAIGKFLHFPSTCIPRAKLFTISKMEKTEMPSQSPMELPKSLNRETRVTLLILRVIRADGLKLIVTSAVID